MVTKNNQKPSYEKLIYDRINYGFEPRTSGLPEHSNGDGRQQQRDGGGLNDHPGLQDHLGLLDQRVLGLPSLTYPSGI